MYYLQRGVTTSHMAVGAQEEVIHKPNRTGSLAGTPSPKSEAEDQSV